MTKQPYRLRMQKLLTALGDLLFPPTQCAQQLRAVSDRELQTLYTPGRCGSCQFLAPYTNPLVQAMILENKFHHNHQAAALLGALLHQWHTVQPNPILYVPVPLGKQRERERGHNQVLSILEACPAKLTIDTTLLVRTTNTPPQTKCSRAARLTNVQKAFVGSDRARTVPADTHVVIIDDVVTTGATLRAAHAALAPHLPKSATLGCLALAH